MKTDALVKADEAAMEGREPYVTAIRTSVAASRSDSSPRMPSSRCKFLSTRRSPTFRLALSQSSRALWQVGAPQM